MSDENLLIKPRVCSKVLFLATLNKTSKPRPESGDDGISPSELEIVNEAWSVYRSCDCPIHSGLLGNEGLISRFRSVQGSPFLHIWSNIDFVSEACSRLCMQVPV